jgi:uncharacterized protein with von Willebrand factor type A (vWA) domain
MSDGDRPADGPAEDGTADPPDFEAAREHVDRELVRFARELRRAGVAVHADGALTAAEALATVGLSDREQVRAATKAALLAGPRDSTAFAEAFPEFWYRLRTGLEATAARDDAGERGDDVGDGGVETDVDGAVADDLDRDAPLAGEEELSDLDGGARSRRVADATGPETGEAGDDERAGTGSPVGERSPLGADEAAGTAVDPAAVAAFGDALASLSGRRWTPAADGVGLDARRALRESAGTGGVAMSLPHRERADTEFRATLLVDVSRSVLDSVDRRFLLSTLDALVADGRSVRVFLFDTEIREVTGAFADSRGDPAAALARAEVAWGGGTRIGDALATLRRRWPHAVDRRAVTVVVSDGLEVGDVDGLAAGAAWLARRSRAVVWLNPLAASPDWAPTARGAAAVAPYVDATFALAGSEDLVDAARQLRRHGAAGPSGYEHDFRDRSGGASQ